MADKDSKNSPVPQATSPTPAGLTSAVKWTQIAIALLANLTFLSPGMGLGFPSTTSEHLPRDQLAPLSESQVSWFASITAIVMPIVGPLTAYLTMKIGRRGTLIVINVISVASWALIGFSSRTNADTLFIQLMIARSLIGASIGMITTPAVMYTSEICHPKIRGSLLVLSPFMLALGMLVVYLLGYTLGDNFRLVSLLALGITVVTLVICILIPESPVYLVSKNKLKTARKVLAQLRGFDKSDPNIDDEIRVIQQSAQASGSKTTGMSLLREFKKPELYKPFLIMNAFFAIQQLSGIFVVFIFAAKFSSEAGVTIDKFLSTVIIGVIRCVMTLMVAFTSDKLGRKPIAIVSSSGMFLGMIGLAICSLFSLNTSPYFWLPAVFLYFFIFTGTVGVLTLPFSMVAEMYPQKTRSMAVGLTLSICFLLTFITTKTFATVFEAFGSSAIFAFYAAISLLGVFFSIFILPETKGKTLQQIENYFRG